MIDQSPALILLAPFLLAIVLALLGIKREWLCFPLVIAGLAISVAASVVTLMRVIDEGPIQYFFV